MNIALGTVSTIIGAVFFFFAWAAPAKTYDPTRRDIKWLLKIDHSDMRTYLYTVRPPVGSEPLDPDDPDRWPHLTGYGFFLPMPFTDGASLILATVPAP